MVLRHLPSPDMARRKRPAAAPAADRSVQEAKVSSGSAAIAKEEEDRRRRLLRREEVGSKRGRSRRGRGVKALGASSVRFLSPRHPTIAIRQWQVPPSTDSLNCATRVTRTADVFSNTGGGGRKAQISTPYDPVHLTHVGFNSTTGEFTVSLGSVGAAGGRRAPDYSGSRICFCLQLLRETHAASDCTGPAEGVAAASAERRRLARGASSSPASSRRDRRLLPRRDQRSRGAARDGARRRLEQVPAGSGQPWTRAGQDFSVWLAVV